MGCLMEKRICFDFPCQTILCIFESVGRKNGAQVLFGHFAGRSPVPFHVLKETGQELSENSFPHLISHSKTMTNLRQKTRARSVLWRALDSPLNFTINL